MSNKVSAFWLSDMLPSTQQLHQRPPRAQFQKDVDINCVFKSKVKFHDVLVIHLLVNLDLLGQLKLQLLVKANYRLHIRITFSECDLVLIKCFPTTLAA